MEREASEHKAQVHLKLQLRGSLEKEYCLFVCVYTAEKWEGDGREIKKTARRQPQERVQLFWGLSIKKTD